MKNLKKLVEILRKAGNREEGIIQAIEEKNSELAQMIRDQMFLFDDIEKFNSKEINLIIQKVNRQTLILSMKGMPENFKGKIYHSVSDRVADSMKDDYDVLGPVKKTDVLDARNEILGTINNMVQDGILNLMDDDVYV